MCEELKITNLKQGVKNPERVNVFVNGRYSFSLDIAQVVDLKIKVGEMLSAEKLAELKKASEFGKTYQRALEWVLVRPRSEREARDYLRRAKFKTSSAGALARGGGSREDFGDFSAEIVSRLIDKGYLDDRKFARWYVENRFIKKGVSQKRLAMELRGKGIASEIINEVLGGRDDEAEIRKIIARKRAKYDDEKLLAYLCRQGFSYELAKSVLMEE